MDSLQFKLYKNAWVDGLPPHLQRKLSDKEMSYYLNKGGLFIRNTYDFDCPQSSFWFVIKDSFGGFEELSTKIRTKVRKSLKTYDIERITPDEFERIALKIYNSAQLGYRVKATLTTQKEIDNLVEKAKQDDTKTDIWAVYTKGERIPVAIAYNTLQGDYCNYNTMKCDPAYQRNSTYPYYGLIFEMNKYYLEDCGMKYVNDGARSITEHSNIQPFLVDNFNFRKAYCKMQIRYKWWIKWAVTILYPFRNIIKDQRLLSILRLEAIHREMQFK